MKAYLQRLREHPGLHFATALTLMGAAAGAPRGGLRGALAGALVMGAFCWIPVLLTARTPR